MTCHKDVLKAVISIIREKNINEFTPVEVIKFLKKRNTSYSENT